MPNNVTLVELRDKIRERGEIRSVYVTDANLNVWINDSIKDLYDQIVSSNPDAFFRVSDNISVVSGREAYELPEDFAALRRVEVLYSGADDWRGLATYSLGGRSTLNLSEEEAPFWRYRQMGSKLYLIPTPNAAGTVRVMYIPVPPSLSEDGDSLDFFFGWDEYVVLDCLVKHAQKEESDSSPFLAKQAACLDRILSRTKVHNYGEPATIRDIYSEVI